MEIEFDEISRFFKELSKLNSEKIQFCHMLRTINPDLTKLPPHLRNFTYDQELVIKLVPQDISGLTIGGIDGGYASRLLTGIEIFFFRAIAVFSTYTPEGIQKTTYYPTKSPPFDIIISDTGLSTLENENLGSIRRVISELQVASQVLEFNNKKIDFLLLDGSPVMKKPITCNPRIVNFYKTYLSVLTRLILQARNFGVKLAWIVKDSRLNFFAKFLGQILPFIFEDLPKIHSLDYRRIINRSRDMDLLYYLLETNVRSMVYRHQFSLSKKHAQEFVLYSYYLKTAPFDIPLRIEVFQPHGRNLQDLIKEINTLSEAILPLSQYNKNFGIPAPIVEADARARIKEIEVERFFQLMQVRYPFPDLWLRRRERIPWKF